MVPVCFFRWYAARRGSESLPAGRADFEVRPEDLAKCGTLSPTKAMPPVTDSAAAASATAVSNRIALSFSTDTPMPIGTGSLNQRRFSRFALYSVKGKRIAAHGRMALMKGQSAPHMFPDSQFAIKSTFWRSADELRTIRPERAIENPAPVNTSLTGCIPAVRLRNCHKRW